MEVISFKQCVLYHCRIFQRGILNAGLVFVNYVPSTLFFAQLSDSKRVYHERCEHY